MFSIIPKETAFFDLFERAARNVHEGTVQLTELLERFDDLPERARRIKDLEHAGDRLTHETLEKLNRTFITPLDREDIHELVCRLDDILDLADEAVGRIILYRIQKPTGDSVALARSLRHAAALVVEALALLRVPKGGESVLRKCADIHAAESEADRIEQHALAALFDNHHDPVEIVKWKDIYQDLEEATDRCEDVANVLEGIVLKNA